MPTADTILTGLTGIANDWRWLAAGWHAVLAGFVAMLVGGWRPSRRTAGVLLVTPVASVGAVGAFSGNPFNGAMFLALAVALAGAAARAGNVPVAYASRAWIARGGALVLFGALYPHFLETESWAAYLVASPFGLLPCPTLSVVIGMTLIFANLSPGLWNVALFAAGLLYAGIGVFGLGVALDWALFVATALLGARLSMHTRATRPSDGDALLDRFIPVYDVVERHQIRVGAPADVTLAVARKQDLLRLPLIRAIFKAREIVMGAAPGTPQPRGLLASTQALGWGILADVPGREVVLGAITKPWQANVTFTALPPDEFAAFAQPGFVKIVWTLRADPVDGETSIFRTETRAVATDAEARGRFRVYWAFASPGIALIRRLSLRPLKRDAERLARGVLHPATRRAW